MTRQTRRHPDSLVRLCDAEPHRIRRSPAAAAALLLAASAALAAPVAFEIPAQPLDRALALFARQAGLQLALPLALAAGRSGPRLSGTREPAEALEELLRGSGLRGRIDGSTLVVEPAGAAAAESTLPAVRVKAATLNDAAAPLRSPAAVGALGSRSAMETPLSTTVVSAEDLQTRQVSKLGDVFARDAAVTDNSDAYTSWASYITVRGLELDWQNAYRIDGRPFLSYAITLPYEHFEQIELLKGSSGFLYGFGSPGGVVNYVSKKPTETRTASAGLGFRSRGVVSADVDLGGRVGEGAPFGYRVGAVHEEGRTLNDGHIRRQSAALAFDARLQPGLTWDAQVLYQDRRMRDQKPAISTQQLLGTPLPAAPRNDDQTLNSGGQFLNTTLAQLSTGLTWQFAPDWRASTSLSHSNARRSRNESILYLQDGAGSYDEFRYDGKEAHRFDQWQAMLEGRVLTGTVEHRIVAGAAWQKQLNDYTANSVWTNLGSGSLYVPNARAYASLGGFDLRRAGDIVQRSVFASDTLTFSPEWSALAGLRHTRYAQNDYAYWADGVRTAEYADTATTPTVALMYTPVPGSLLYGSYMESLEPGHTVGTTYANAGRQLAPLVSKQAELGVKLQRAGWAGTAALFRIERASEYADAANVLVQDGVSVYQGLELGVAGRLGAQWDAGANLMLLDATLDKGSANVGNRVAGAPRRMATAYLAWHVPGMSGLKLSADAKHTGAVMLDAANTRELPAHWLLNLGASLDTRLAGRAATLRVAVNNATDRRFWAFQYSNWVKPAEPRSLSVSARMEF
jgi:iron complex outermembrane receptor protein